MTTPLRFPASRMDRRHAQSIHSRNQNITSYTSFLSGLSFLIAVFTYFVSGVVAASAPPQPITSFGSHKVPLTATCARVSRHTSFTTIDFSFGHPSVSIRVLLRLDEVVGVNDTSLRLFSSRVAESNTVRCNNTVCTDVILLHRAGPTNGQTKHIVKFEYTNPTTESLAYGTGVILGLGGELSLRRGYDYWLTATHFCWQPAEPLSAADSEAAVHAHIVYNSMVVDAFELSKSESLGATPVATAQINGTCPTANVSLFPVQAADETRWLGLSSERVYETAPQGVDGRRAVVEVGTACAAVLKEYEQPFSLYQLDCLSAYTPCDVSPSIPFRRVATDQMRLHIPSDGSEEVCLFTNHDPRLESLPQLEASGNTSRWLSLLKLSLMILAAAVVWVRAAKATSSISMLVMHCLRAAYCGLHPSSTSSSETSVLEDSVIGMIAIVARLGVTVWRMLTTLLLDDQLRVLVLQLIASVVSFALWFLRYFVLDRACETPLTKLGGTTALVDATTAVMMGFGEAPLFVSSVERFDPTARLLTALLISTVTSHRCLFSTTCCGLLVAVISSEDGTTARQAFDKGFLKYVCFAFFGWLIQTCSVAVLIVDLFCVPLAHSMVRSQASTWEELALAIFLGTFACSLPQLLKTLRLIAEEPVVQSENKKAS
jgi:hypothetical protein